MNLSESAEQLFDYEQVAKRIANICLTMKNSSPWKRPTPEAAVLDHTRHAHSAILTN